MHTSLQYDELEDLGFRGFAIGFKNEYTQIVGTSEMLKAFSPPLVEYLHAQVIIAGWSLYAVHEF